MECEFDWHSFENSSAENGRLGQILRGLEGIHESDPSFDWKKSRRRSAEVLRKNLVFTEADTSLASLMRGADFEVGGDEHLIIRLEKHPDRVFKLTHGECFGCRPFFSPADPDLMGRHFLGSINEDPIFYLRRWMLLNHLGIYQTRFEGVLPPEEGLLIPRFCISQPVIEAENPSPLEIELALASHGFEKIAMDAFLNFQSRILLTDTAPRNVRIVEGSIALFDAIALRASDSIVEWAHASRKERT